MKRETTPLPRDIADVLLAADRVELLSLDPNWRGKQTTPKNFHDYAVLGQVEITDRVKIERVAKAIIRAGEEGGYPLEGFKPHHGIHAEHEKQARDLLISFECGQIQIYPGEALANFSPVSKSVEIVLDQLLVEAGVPIAPKTP
jgi:hypothetical protein